MADISREIENFRSAIQGEEVRGSLISVTEKLNAVTEESERKVTAAANTANTASDTATAAAEAAQTAITQANKTLEAANTAKAAAAQSAQGAASSATAAAESARNASTSASAAAQSAEVLARFSETSFTINAATGHLSVTVG